MKVISIFVSSIIKFRAIKLLTFTLNRLPVIKKIMSRYNFTIGKFQPFHAGHERLVRRMILQGDDSWEQYVHPDAVELIRNVYREKLKVSSNV